MPSRRAFLWGITGLVAGAGRAAHAHAESGLALRLPDPPHPPGDAPDLMVHLPPRLEPGRALHAVVFLHGFSCCARALLNDAPVPCYTHGPRGQAYGLARLHDQSAVHALLIVPQLAMLARDARAPRLARAGGFDGLMEAVQAAVAAQLGRAPVPGRVLLVAHSAGYRAAADILADGARRRDVERVLLLDALYARWDDFAQFVAQGPEHLLVSLHTAEARTSAGNERLLARLGPRGQRLPYAELASAIRDPGTTRAIVSRVATPHGAMPARHYTELARALLG